MGAEDNRTHKTAHRRQTARGKEGPRNNDGSTQNQTGGREPVVMAEEDGSLLASDPPPPPALTISTIIINKDLLVRLNSDQFLKLKCNTLLDVTFTFRLLRMYYIRHLRHAGGSYWQFILI